MPVVSLDRGQLHYETRGAGPPIVMLLPVSRGPEGLEPLIELLGTGFLVIRYDQIGHGASTSTGNPQDGRPAGPVPLSVRAAEVVALLDHLGIERANLLAHSTGCGIALEIFAAAPERVRAMALISPWSHGDDQLRTMQSLRVAAAGALNPVDYATYNASLLFPPWYRRQFADGFKAMAEAAAATPQDATVIEHGLIPILNFDGRGIAGTVTCPTMIMAARDDQLMPPWHSETLAALIGGSRHEVLDTGGHMLLETRRETIAERVASFFSESH